MKKNLLVFPPSTMFLALWHQTWCIGRVSPETSQANTPTSDNHLVLCSTHNHLFCTHPACLCTNQKEIRTCFSGDTPPSLLRPVPVIRHDSAHGSPESLHHSTSHSNKKHPGTVGGACLHWLLYKTFCSMTSRKKLCILQREPGAL